MIVSNASPLIVLGKIAELELLRHCFTSVLIPSSVFDEIMKKKESVEAIALGRAIIERWISVEQTTVSALLQTPSLGLGEKEAISLAAKRKALLIIDDDLAKQFAALLGVEAHGTVYALLVAVRKKILTSDQANECLQQMMGHGFYLSTEVYARFISLLQTMKK